jgi:hypothetical protein
MVISLAPVHVLQQLSRGLQTIGEGATAFSSSWFWDWAGRRDPLDARKSCVKIMKD